MKKILLAFLLLGQIAHASYVIPPGSVTRTKLATGAVAKTNLITPTTTYSTSNTDDVVSASGASFTITLHTAVGNKGEVIRILHSGTSLSQVYTLATTSGQTIGGIASGSYALYTNGESLALYSDNANWQILEHTTATNIVSTGPITFSATSAYTFTIPSSSITIGTIYTNNGCTFTVSATTSASTTLTGAGTCTPSVSGTLTFVSGSPSGNLAFSARTITGVPSAGTTSVNSMSWSRNGVYATITYSVRNTAGGANGSGEYIFYFPAGISALSSLTTYMLLNNFIGTLAGQDAILPGTTGFFLSSAGTASFTPSAFLYTSSAFRISMLVETGGTLNSGNLSSTFFQLGNVLSYNFTVVIPVQGWQP